MTAAVLSMSEFAREILGQPLWSHQEQAGACDEFILVIAGGRRSGAPEDEVYRVSAVRIQQIESVV
jgi:hypothetical protein